MSGQVVFYDGPVNFLMNKDGIAAMLAQMGLPMPDDMPRKFLSYDEVKFRGLKKSDGSEPVSRYTLTQGGIFNESYEDATYGFEVREDGSGKEFVTYDFIRMRVGPWDPKTGKRTQSSSMAVLTHRNKRWYALMQLQYRTLMGWTLGTPGGYTPKGKKLNEATLQEIAEEFGVAETLGMEIFGYDQGFKAVQDRATYEGGNALGYIVVKDESWQISADPGGFEQIHQMRIGLPLSSIMATCFEDDIVTATLKVACAAYLRGDLTKYM